MIDIKLTDKSVKKYEKGIKVIDAARDISEGLARVITAAKVNGETVGLDYKIDSDAELVLLKFDDKEGAYVYRHTASHVLAQAVKEIYPDAKLAIGPAIDNGFYYDFDVSKPFSSGDLEKIEEKMQEIIKKDIQLEKYSLSRQDALKLMEEKNEPYKTELIRELTEGEEITFYKQGNFVDLCRGPHLLSTGRLKAVKLIQAAGAYWRGDEKNKMLQRIYGTAFDNKKELKKYLNQLEEAKKRDHNKLGRELDIFMTAEPVGQGLPLLMPKGAKIIQVLQRFVEDEEEKRGYVYTKTPYMAKSDLYKISGHWDHYRDGMFIMGDDEKDQEVLALRPMTCPFQFMIYKNGLKSYRDLPVRYAETSTLFRNESSGEMHGLTRVRQFTLSEGHIICTPGQLEKEFTSVIELIDYMMDALGIKEDIWYRFSKWDPDNKEKYIDNPKAWEESQSKMKVILDKLKIDYVEADGEAAFYGPKLDIQAKNVFGKEDTIITVQIDFALAERFDMTYIDSDGQKKRPYVIHRSSIGCYERTLAMLIEKFAGAFPVWLAPVQVKILPIIDKHFDYAEKIKGMMEQKGIRAELDLRNEKIGYKIREARLEKAPYMLIIGDREAEEDTVSVRSRKEGDMGALKINDFISLLLKEITTKEK